MSKLIAPGMPNLGGDTVQPHCYAAQEERGTLMPPAGDSIHDIMCLESIAIYLLNITRSVLSLWYDLARP